MLGEVEGALHIGERIAFGGGLFQQDHGALHALVGGVGERGLVEQDLVAQCAVEQHLEVLAVEDITR